MTEKTLHEHLVEIQFLLKAPKSNYIAFGGFYHRSAEDILEALKPHLKERNLALVCSSVPEEIAGHIFHTVTVSLQDDKFQFTATASAREPLEKKKLDSSQLSGGAISYAKKYALGNLFAIDDEKDADTQDNSATKVEKKLKIEENKDLISSGAISAIISELSALNSEQLKMFRKFLADNNLSFGDKDDNGNYYGWNITDSDLDPIYTKISEIIEPIH